MGNSPTMTLPTYSRFNQRQYKSVKALSGHQIPEII